MHALVDRPAAVSVNNWLPGSGEASAMQTNPRVESARPWDGSVYQTPENAMANSWSNAVYVTTTTIGEEGGIGGAHAAASGGGSGGPNQWDRGLYATTQGVPSGSDAWNSQIYSTRNSDGGGGGDGSNGGRNVHNESGRWNEATYAVSPSPGSVFTASHYAAIGGGGDDDGRSGQEGQSEPPGHWDEATYTVSPTADASETPHYAAISGEPGRWDFATYSVQPPSGPAFTGSHYATPTQAAAAAVAAAAVERGSGTAGAHAVDQQRLASAANNRFSTVLMSSDSDGNGESSTDAQQYVSLYN